MYSFVPDSNTRLNGMKAGQYHWARLEPTQVEQVAAMTGYRVHLISSNSFMHLDLSVNLDRGRRLFTDRGVREAIFRGIDRQAIADQLMQGTVRLANSPINPTSPYHNAAVPVPAYDPALAREMLEGAGWSVGSDGIRVKEGERFSFNLLNRAGAADRIAIAQVVQAQLKQIGVEVTMETLESAAWTQKWRSGDWEGIISAWFLPADPSITNLYACEGHNNMTGFCDPVLDRLLEASDRLLNFDERADHQLEVVADESGDALGGAADGHVDLRESAARLLDEAHVPGFFLFLSQRRHREQQRYADEHPHRHAGELTTDHSRGEAFAGSTSPVSAPAISRSSGSIAKNSIAFSTIGSPFAVTRSS